VSIYLFIYNDIVNKVMSKKEEISKQTKKQKRMILQRLKQYRTSFFED